MTRLWLAALVACLAACGSQNPMQLTTADGEQFTGVLNTGAEAGPAGDFDLRNARGMRCVGRYQLSPRYTATLTLTCEDGRTGLGDMTVAGKVATITGTLGGRPFTGTIQRVGL